MGLLELESAVSLDVLKNIKKNISCEGKSIDFKREFHFKDKREKLEIIKDIVALANTDGGYLIYGVNENGNEFHWEGLDERSDTFNDIQIAEFISSYANYPVNFRIAEHEISGDIFYILYVSKHAERDLIQFIRDGNYEKIKLNGKQESKCVFKRYEEYGRKGSKCCVVNTDTLFKKTRNSDTKILTNMYEMPSPYTQYVTRENKELTFLEKFRNPNINALQINGLGGIGKTSFIRNFCEKISRFEIPDISEKYKFIVWITAKLTLFEPTGEIKPFRQKEISYDDVIKQFADVFSIDIEQHERDSKREDMVLDALKTYPAIIIFDNMETINDQKIINFLQKIPFCCKTILTTREDMDDIIYHKMVLDGFTHKEFVTYLKNQIQEYDTRKSINYEKDIYRLENDIFSLTQGSPIIINMLAYRVCNGEDLATMLNGLRNTDFNLVGKSNDDISLYEKAMNFCFKETVSRLDTLDKEILYILSTTEATDEFFDIHNIYEILGQRYDKSLINQSLSRLNKISFINKIESKYNCLNLIKLFANRTLGGDQSVDTLRIHNGLSIYYRLKNKIDLGNEFLYKNAKAYSFEEKIVVNKLTDRLLAYEETNDYEMISKVFDELISENPNYFYLYFRRAMVEKKAESDPAVVRGYFERALRYDEQNDHIWTEFAFYEQTVGNSARALEYFKNAIKINDRNFSAYHGIALLLKKRYKAIDDETGKQKNMILEYFEKGYSQLENGYGITHNIKNSHAHAHYLMKINELDKALEICNKGLSIREYDKSLQSLKGTIEKKIDPNKISETMMNKLSRGVFESTDPEVLRQLAEMVYSK